MSQQNVQLETVLQMSGFSFQYPMREKVLNDAALDLKTGEKVALVGENGAGKTTLFHLLTGLINRQSGKLLCMGKTIESEADFVYLRQKVGLVFQDPDDQLFCPSVLEDVMFGPLNQGFGMDEAKRKAVRVLEQLKLGHLSENMASQLSGGEKRMVTLASVLQAWIGRQIIVNVIKTPLDLSSLKHSVQSLIVAGPICCVIAAGVGTSLLALNNVIPTNAIFDNFIAWWIGDSIGVLIFTPLVLAAFNYTQVRHRMLVILPSLLIYILISASFYGAASVKKEKDIQKKEAYARLKAVKIRKFVYDLNENDRLQLSEYLEKQSLDKEPDKNLQIKILQTGYSPITYINERIFSLTSYKQLKLNLSGFK